MRPCCPAQTFAHAFASQVGALWRDAPENPNRGQEPKSRTKKAPQAKAKAKKAGDETATSEPDPAED